MTDPSNIPFGKKILLQSLAGGSAGFVEINLMQPLDVIKTRLQLQSQSNIAPEDRYNGIFDCVSKMYRKEGALSFYKGIVPPMMIEVPKRAVKFTFFEQSLPFFLFGKPEPQPLSYLLAGLTSGVCEGLTVNTFEVVKVEQQAQRGNMRQSESAFVVAKRIIRDHGFGLKGINRGLEATIVRDALFNTVYFGCYHSVKDVLPAYTDQRKEFARKFGLGFCASVIACLLNTPFDMVKSSLQGPLGYKKYHTLPGTLRTVYAEEGIKGVYKGLGPRLLRIGPGGAIMLMVYEHMYKFLFNKLNGP